jgi:hypothetical protein
MNPTIPFSYTEYQEIINHLRNTTTIMDYSEIHSGLSEYCVIRHDVEFSVERALGLAIFERQQLDLSSSYLFQIRNNCYNLCSDTSIRIMHEILALGHSVGLHLHFGMLNNTHQINDYILQEVDLFERLTGIKIDRFSYHRPPTRILRKYIEIDNLINCYGKDYFHYFDQPPAELPVKYYTDSRHIWKFGHPIDNTSKKVQLLTHPYSWTQQGFDNTENFSNILREKHKQMTHSINNETSTFPKELLR